MSLTQLEINTLSPGNEGSFTHSSIEFNCQCVVNEAEISSHYNIFWIQKGQAEVSIDFQTYDIQPNTIFFLRPGQVFSVLSEQKLSGFRLAFDERFYCIQTSNPEIGCHGLLFNELTGTPGINIDKQSSVAETFESIKGTFEQSMDLRSELLEAYLRILLIQCTELKKNTLRNYNQEQEDLPEFVRRFNLLVEKKFREWHSLKPYAEQFGLSPQSLTKRLARFNAKPSHLIYNRLIAEAKRLLIYTDKSIKEIAYLLNFDDPPHFSKFFKRHTGFAPAKFREDHKS